MSVDLLDVSNFDWPFTRETVECLAAEGYSWFIVGSQRPPLATAQIAAIRDAGSLVQGTYAFLYHGQDTLGQVRAAIALAQAAGARYVWLDCEATPPHEAEGMTPAVRVAEIRACVDAVEAAGLQAGIYTGRWWWPARTAGSTEFAHLPLWHSEYPNDEHAVRTVDYGGWSRVAIHQFSSTRVLCGRERDRNYVFNETLLSDDEEDGMSDDDLLAIFAGSEETGPDGALLPREERLLRARYRRDEAAAGRAPSVRELATHVQWIGDVPNHLHLAGEVIR